jgi:hypothetical protein
MLKCASANNYSIKSPEDISDISSHLIPYMYQKF